MRLFSLFILSAGFVHAANAQAAPSAIRTATKIVRFDDRGGAVAYQEVILAGELCRLPANTVCQAIELKNVTFQLQDGTNKKFPSVIFANENISDFRSDLTKTATFRYVNTKKELVLAAPGALETGDTVIAGTSKKVNLVGIREVTNLQQR